MVFQYLIIHFAYISVATSDKHRTSLQDVRVNGTFVKMVCIKLVNRSIIKDYASVCMMSRFCLVAIYYLFYIHCFTLLKNMILGEFMFSSGLCHQGSQGQGTPADQSIQPTRHCLHQSPGHVLSPIL